MARNYPADVKLQHFYEEQYAKEDGARLDWYYANKRGQAPGKGGGSGSRQAQSAINDGLPRINPMEYALKVKKKEDQHLKEIIQEARKKYSKEEMRPADRSTKDKLYEGFTKEGRGRYAYLQDRHRIIPEKKFTFPTLSSMKYGWKLDESFQLKRPDFARTRLIKDSFYKRNGVPDLDDVTHGECLSRGYTFA